MSTIINIGCIYSNNPTQNAGWFFGQFNMAGWNANQKINSGQGGINGILVANFDNVSINCDDLEGSDGNMSSSSHEDRLSAYLPTNLLHVADRRYFD